MSSAYLNAPVEYRPIEGFENYRVGDDGSVWSRLLQKRPGGIGPWRKLKPVPRKGYLRAGLRKEFGGRLYWRAVHRLVLEAFRGPCPVGMEACHSPNPDRSDNRLDNLRWDTPQRNSLDKREHGTMVCGSRHKDAKLTEADIPEILARIAGGESRRSIARSKGVSHSAINSVARGESWIHSQGSGDTNGRENAAKERIWFSPHCIKPRRERTLFDGGS